MPFTRFAIYYTPPDGPFADFGAHWLGWNVASGLAVDHISPYGFPTPIDQITETPRRYGFHATLKPPFRLATDQPVEALCQALNTFSSTQKPVNCEGLHIVALGSFLALVPLGNASGLNRLAARTVRELDRFRAPPCPQELVRRRKHHLSQAQESNLSRWGYPYVMDEFRFHMTLTGKLSKSDLRATQSALEPITGPLISQPFNIRDLTLAGEDERGMFRQIQRFDLAA